MKTFWLVLFSVYAGFVSAAELSCTALVQDAVDGDLYLTDENDAPIRRLTTDGRLKFGAALSPQADKASFFFEKPGMKMQVVTRDGEVRTFALEDDIYHLATQPSATRWDSEDLVLVQFWGHANSVFEWVGVGTTRAPSNVPKAAADPEFRMGSGCASAPQGRHIACVAGDLISIDDRTEIFIDPFKLGHQLGPFKVVERVPTPLPGYDGASFTVVYVRQDGTEIRAGVGEYQPEMFLPDNGFGLVERVGELAWGEFLVVSHHEASGADAGGAAVAVRVLDVAELPEIGGALAWTEDGSTLAAINVKPGFGSDLLLVQRARGKGGRWQISKTLALGQDYGSADLRFIDASTIYVRSGGGESAIYAIRRDHLELVKSLPNYFPGSGGHDSGAHHIRDWSCERR